MGKFSGVFNLVADPALPDEARPHVTMDKSESELLQAKQALNGLGTQRLLDGCEVTAKVDGTGFNVVVPRGEDQTNGEWAAHAERVASELSYRMADIGNTTHKGGRIYCKVPAGSMTKEAFEERCNAPQGADKIDFETALFDELGAVGVATTQDISDPIMPPVPEVEAANGLMADVVLAGSDVTKMVDGAGYNVVVPREEGESNKQWAGRSKNVADVLDGLGVEIKNETHRGGRIYCAVSGDDDPEVNEAFEGACWRTAAIAEIKANFEKIGEYLQATGLLGAEAVDALNRSVEDAFGGRLQGDEPTQDLSEQEPLKPESSRFGLSMDFFRKEEQDDYLPSLELG